MAYTLPAIVHRLESNLIAMEACKGLGLNLRPDLALEAMTKDSDNTSEHAEEQINFQKGMGNNYERLEFLGDSFLKMSTTIALFALKSDSNEFQYHVDRMVMVCNKNLFNNALELKLEESIRSKSFNRRLWYPDGLEQTKGKQIDSILGKKGAGRGIHVLADKSIADVCEALIGAAYLTTYEQGSFDLAVQAVTKFVAHEHHTMKTFADFHTKFVMPEWQTAEPTAVHLHLARQMETTLGYRFQYPRLLRSAFIHPSYSFMYEHIPHYQRLEFLGDALLDMVCVDHLFHRFPGADPQWLTEHKMAMVSNQFLGCLCVELGFYRHMMYMSGDLPRLIADYVATITAARDTAQREAVDAGRPASAYARDFWTAAADPPKCLPDLVEAYLGAVFVDSGFDYAQVRRFFAERVLPYFGDMRAYDTFANKHPTTLLAHVAARHFGCARLHFVLQEVPVPGGRAHETHVVCGVLVHGNVVAAAPAASGRYAKTAAAKKATALLEGMPVEEFKAKYRCRCTAQEADEASEQQNGSAE